MLVQQKGAVSLHETLRAQDPTAIPLVKLLQTTEGRILAACQLQRRLVPESLGCTTRPQPEGRDRDASRQDGQVFQADGRRLQCEAPAHE